MEENKCCANCAHMKKLEKLDYTQGGCIHTLAGWCCTCLADEDVIDWMYGLNEDTEFCEMYSERKNTVCL